MICKRCLRVATGDPVEKLARTLGLFEFYQQEARKCGDGGAYLAGGVLLASALEAALLAMAQCFPQDVKRAVRASGSKEMARPPEDLGLSQLLDIARRLDWLPSAGEPAANIDPSKAQVGDYVEVIRALRNLVHPSVCLKEFDSVDVRPEHLDLLFRVLDAACDCLGAALRDAESRLTP